MEELIKQAEEDNKQNIEYQMENNSKTITVLIDYQRYPLKIKKEEELLYQDTEKLINSLIHKYRTSWPELSDTNHLSMALLELGYQYLTLKEQIREE